jgi:hypothetical protein
VDVPRRHRGLQALALSSPALDAASVVEGHATAIRKDLQRLLRADLLSADRERSYRKLAASRRQGEHLLR